jgi:diguanylate cyclase (GGDEF)-like protein/PAS domain S-box-containing protein
MELDLNQYKMIVESSPVIIWKMTPEGMCDYMNARGIEFTGRTLEDELEEGWMSLVHPEDVAYYLTVYSQAAQKQEPFKMAFRMKRHDGEWRWINAIGQPYFIDGLFKGYTGCYTDVTEQMAWEQLQYMAQNDGLTGVKNRQFFEQLAYDELEKAKRYNTSLCAVLVNIDRFHEINDTYGHAAGDKILQGFSRLLTDHIRFCDLLGRYGGDEFIILLPHTAQKDAHVLMKRIGSLMKEPLEMDEERALEVSCSYGIAELEQCDTLESLEARADREMQRMKIKMK